ncbi:response regulator transcription factor [Alphaproteobacteria bacterium]|jgi:two-component system phosphate regulon response regulator OmpR|nr:response regulator transcription factor [Alphaproteobacteria bacterium]
MSNHHILIIDDDERLRLLLRRFLEESGFRVSDVASTLEARQILTLLAFDMLIIDIMMPGETGLEFLTDLRKSNPVPALFLTALAETENRIQGLELGADDYMSKPFEPRELVLRIKSILGRTRGTGEPTSRVSFGPFLFDTEAGILTRHGERIHITTAEHKLLGSFAVKPDQVLSRDDLAAAMDGSMKGRSIDVAVARLRGKLEPDPRYPVYLQTVRNKGWLLQTDNEEQHAVTGNGDAAS